MSAVGHLWVCVIVVHKSFKLKPLIQVQMRNPQKISLPSPFLEWGLAFKVYKFIFCIQVDISEAYFISRRNSNTFGTIVIFITCTYFSGVGHWDLKMLKSSIPYFMLANFWKEVLCPDKFLMWLHCLHWLLKCQIWFQNS